MSTYRELTYLVMDELKGFSDDFSFTEDHVVFLLNKYRAFLLKQKYSDVKKQIPESNYQTICLDLTEVDSIDGKPCEAGSYLRTTEKIPTLMAIGNPQVYPTDYYQGEITYVTRERMRYVGYNRWLLSIIYASLGPDGYLYLTSSNSNFKHLEKIRMTGIFEDTEAADELSCDEGEDKKCDILDKDFPLEESLISPLLETVIKDLSGALYKPKDNENNANDDLASMATFLRNNVKSPLQKQIDGNG